MNEKERTEPTQKVRNYSKSMKALTEFNERCRKYNKTRADLMVELISNGIKEALDKRLPSFRIKYEKSVPLIFGGGAVIREAVICDVRVNRDDNLVKIIIRHKMSIAGLNKKK